MQTLREEDISPPAAFARCSRSSLSCANHFPPFSLFSSVLARKSLSYDRLRRPPLTLTVLKLDGSSFDIRVAKSATVSDLKLAVEAAFGHLPKDGLGEVSWSHVWGHFCLSYDGQRLITENDYIQSYGIKAGDQLKFVRHVPINFEMVQMKSEKKVADTGKPRISDISEEEIQDDEADDCVNQENLDVNLDDCRDKTLIKYTEYKWAHLLKGWLSHCKLTRTDMRLNRREVNRMPPSLPRRVLGICGKIYDSNRDT